VAAEPVGKTREFIIDGTPKPGTVMQVKAGVEPVNGVWTAEVYNAAADGNQRVIMVLLEDWNQGIDITTAYVSGTRGMIYFPTPGELLNMLYLDVAGTADDHAIGDIMIVGDGTGKLIATTGTPESEPFICYETVTDPAADHHTLSMFTGY
jgi:hypothetical protein